LDRRPTGDGERCAHPDNDERDAQCHTVTDERTHRAEPTLAPMGDMTSDHLIRNRAAWNVKAADYVAMGRSSWAAEPNWGVWSIPETEVHLLPEVTGLDTVELGCGSGYISGWLKRLGARPVGIDNNGMLHMLTVPADEGVADDVLKRDYFDMHRVEWPDDEGIEFHLGYGDWIRLLRRCGFSVENLVELRPPEGTTEGRPYLTAEWARRWPSEEVWVARRI
jgi:hypothetical protein